MAKKANKVGRSHVWVIGTLVLIILGTIAWKYFGTEITGSRAGTSGGVVWVNVSSTMLKSEIVIGGTTQRQEVGWGINLINDPLFPPKQALLRGIQVKVVETASHITNGYLEERGGAVLATAKPMADPVRGGIFLLFKFQQPRLIPSDGSFNLDLFLDHGRVDGKIIKNDQPYYVVIERPTDVWAMWKDGSGEAPVRFADNWTRSWTSYLFENVINLSADPSTPSGAAIRQPNHTIAKMNVLGNPPVADVGFYGKNRNFLKVVLSSNRKSGSRTTVYLKNSETGAIISTASADLSRGNNTLIFRFGKADLVAPAGKKITLSLVTDTTSLIGQTSQSLNIYVGDLNGTDKNCLGWGINGIGNYNHCDLLPVGFSRSLDF